MSRCFAERCGIRRRKPEHRSVLSVVCVCVHACSECVLYSCKPFLLDDVLERVNVGGYCEFFVFFLSECLCMPACVMCVCVCVCLPACVCVCNKWFITFVLSRYTSPSLCSCPLVCFVFGWVGYLFACCFMVTVAASTGSAAGFGLYLVQTAVFINVSSFWGTVCWERGWGICGQWG